MDTLEPEYLDIRAESIGDPRWLMILRAVALVLAIILMSIALIVLVGVYRGLQDRFEELEDTSTTEPAEETEESFQPTPGPGQTPESLDWYQPNEDGSTSYCYEVQDPYEVICEPVP